MSRTVRAIIIGFAAALVVGVIFGLLEHLDGENHGGAGTLASVGIGIGAAYISYNLSGNRRIANASDADKRAALDRTPPPGKALLFLYREGYLARLVGMDLTVDEKPVAQLKSPRFTCLVVNPGSHAIAARFGAVAGTQNQAQCTIDAPADGAVVIRITSRLTVNKGGIDMQPQTDLAAAKTRMAGMPMTPPDLAEV